MLATPAKPCSRARSRCPGRASPPRVGDRAEELLAYHRLRGDHVILAGARAQVVVRARIAEDRLAAAGAGQYVILGAGLDSFAYRSPLADGMRVLEVDHPATQDAQ